MSQYFHRHLSSELQEHEKLIEKMIAAEFNKYIADDLNRPLSDLKDLLDEVIFKPEFLELWSFESS